MLSYYVRLKIIRSLKLGFLSLMLSSCSLPDFNPLTNNLQTKEKAPTKKEPIGGCETKDHMKVYNTSENHALSGSVVDLVVYSSRLPGPDRHKIATIRITNLKAISVLSSTGEKSGELVRAIDRINKSDSLELDGETMTLSSDCKPIISHVTRLVSPGDRDFVDAVRSELSKRGFGTESGTP